MKLYDENNPAPNPRRVRIFLAEKGVDIPRVRINMRQREHKAPEHKARNSLGQVPTLELDDGTMISESVAICRYLESIYPQPPMFGTTPIEAARIDMMIRRVEFQIMTPVGMFWRHAHPLTAPLLTQFKDFGESNRAHYAGGCKWLDREIAERDFIAGDAYSMADIIALTTVDFAAFTGLEMSEDCATLRAWHARVTARPSAAA